MSNICTWKSLSTLEKCQIVFAETIGTACLLFGGCAGTLAWGGQSPPHLVPSVTFGLVLMIIIQTYGHLPGGHPYLNPALTLAAVVFRMISISMAILCFMAQIVGATFGVWVLMLIVPSKVYEQTEGDNGVCVTVPNEDLDLFQGFLAEYIATMLLIFMCCAIWDPRNRTKKDSIPIKAGLALMLLCVIFIPFTGASMNPARSFGPAFWGRNFKDHWVYWVAPMLSALLTSVGYKVLFLGKLNADLENNEPLNDDNTIKGKTWSLIC